MLVCNFHQFDEIKPMIWPISCVQVLPTTFFCISFRTRAKSVPLALVMLTAFELFQICISALRDIYSTRLLGISVAVRKNVS